MNGQEILEIISNINYPGYTFHLRMVEDANTTSEGYLIYATYDEEDIHTGKVEKQTTRKWYQSSHSCKSEVVQTCLKCILTSAEHRVREHFTYRGRLTHGPHLHVDTLHDVANSTDSRKQVV